MYVFYRNGRPYCLHCRRIPNSFPPTLLFFFPNFLIITVKRDSFVFLVSISLIINYQSWTSFRVIVGHLCVFGERFIQVLDTHDLWPHDPWPMTYDLFFLMQQQPKTSVVFSQPMGGFFAMLMVFLVLVFLISKFCSHRFFPLLMLWVLYPCHHCQNNVEVVRMISHCFLWVVL